MELTLVFLLMLYGSLIPTPYADVPYSPLWYGWITQEQSEQDGSTDTQLNGTSDAPHPPTNLPQLTQDPSVGKELTLPDELFGLPDGLFGAPYCSGVTHCGSEEKGYYRIEMTKFRSSRKASLIASFVESSDISIIAKNPGVKYLMKVAVDGRIYRYRASTDLFINFKKIRSVSIIAKSGAGDGSIDVYFFKNCRISGDPLFLHSSDSDGKKKKCWFYNPRDERGDSSTHAILLQKQKEASFQVFDMTGKEILSYEDINFAMDRLDTQTERIATGSSSDQPPRYFVEIEGDPKDKCFFAFLSCPVPLPRYYSKYFRAECVATPQIYGAVTQGEDEGAKQENLDQMMTSCAAFLEETAEARWTSDCYDVQTKSKRLSHPTAMEKNCVHLCELQVWLKNSEKDQQMKIETSKMLAETAELMHKYNKPIDKSEFP